MRLPAVIVDMDHTLCDVREAWHLAEAGDYPAFHAACVDMPPYPAVVAWVCRMHRLGHQVLVVTGRDDPARENTAEWLARHSPVPIRELRMRADGDHRPNVELKRDIHADLSRWYDVRAAIEDQEDVAEMWTELGIPTTQVIDGILYPPAKPSPPSTSPDLGTVC